MGILCTPFHPWYLFKIWAQHTPDGYIVVFHYLALTVNRAITTQVIRYPILYTKSLVNLPFLNQPGNQAYTGVWFKLTKHYLTTNDHYFTAKC